MKIHNLLIDDEIGTDGITAEFVRAEIAKAKQSGADEIRVIMNSPGGSVYEGYSIYNALKSAGIRVNTFVTGQCASIATLIACAGENITTSPVSQWMFHKPSGGAQGNATDLISQAEALQQIEETMAEVYAQKMGKQVAEGLALMSKGDYYIKPNDLASIGFVNTIATPPSAFIKTDIEMIKNEKEAKSILSRLFKALAETPTAGSIMLQDGSAEIYFEGEEITSGTVLYVNAEMTETAPEGDHVLADGKIVTLDASGAIVRIAEIEASVEQQIADAVDTAVATALAEAEAKHAEAIASIEAKHTEALASVKADVVALSKLVVSDSKVPAPKAVAPKVDAKVDSALDIQAKQLKQSMGLK